MANDDALFERTIYGQPLAGFDPARVRPGTWDLRVIYQSTVWVDRAGRVHQLAQMPTGYLRNLAAFLTMQAEVIHAVEWRVEALGMDVSAGEFLAARASGAPGIREVDPYDYVEGSELMRAIRRLAPDTASPAELRAWAESAHARLSRDRTARITLPQDPDREWNA